MINKRIKLPYIHVFETDCTLKEQALKIVEEAAEVVDAVKSGNEDAIAYEIMDVIQAAANLIALKQYSPLDLFEAYKKVLDTNRERDRYGEVD